MVYRCLVKQENATYSVNAGLVDSNQKDCMMVVSQQMHNWLHMCSLALTGVVVISSAFHFWPFDESNAWQLFCPSNSALFIWVLILTGHFVVKRDYWTYYSLLPHLSVHDRFFSWKDMFDL